MPAVTLGSSHDLVIGDMVAAYTAFGKLDGLYWMVIGAFGVTVTTFVGQNFGAQRVDRMRKSVRVCMTLSVAFTLALEALFYCGR